MGVTLDHWWAGGHRTARGIFTRADGPAAAPVTTWLHGFPTSSWDWVPLHAELGGGRRDVTLDFLGFGASEKPRGHHYSLIEQADLVEDVWREHGVGETVLVAHDYGVSVAQELLARRAEGRLEVELHALGFLNGGLFPQLHRPVRIQRLVAGPLGPLAARLTTERTFTRALRGVMAITPSDEELHEHWRAFSRDGGHGAAHRLLEYIAERHRNEQRWVGALIADDLPKHFAWGPLDPVSGAHMLPEIRAQLPSARVTVLDGIGHYPQLEATAATAAALSALWPVG